MDLIYGVLQSIGFNWKVALFDLINFLILFALLKKFLFGKVTETLEERENIIKESLENAEEVKSQLSMAEQRAKDIIVEAKTEANGIIQKSHENAEKVTAKLKEEAQSEVEKIIDKAKKQAEGEREQMIKDLKSDTADLVVSTVEKLIKTKLDGDQDQKIVNDLLDSIK